MGYLKIEPAKALDRLITIGLSPLLKEADFKRLGRTFYKPSNDLYHAIHIQTSATNSLDDVKFTINLAIASPEISQLWLGETPPQNPASPKNHLLVARIGDYLPTGNLSTSTSTASTNIRGDHWWEISRQTDMPALTEEIQTALRDYGLKFFNHAELQSIHALLKAFEDGKIKVIQGIYADQTRHDLYAVLLYQVGRIQEAQATLTELIEANRTKSGLDGYVGHIQRLKKRLI